MTKLLNFFKQRSKREQNLIIVVFVLILCLLAMSFVSNIVAQSSLATKRYQNAKSDYEYVIAGAMNLLSSAKISEIKNNRTTLKPGIQDIAKSHDLKLKHISTTGTSLSISFVPDKLDKTKQLLEDISRLSGLALDTFELENESGQKLVTATYQTKMNQSSKAE
jgi:septal ring-binding cell division protein DamX